MKKLLMGPYSFDALKVEKDSNGRAIVRAKIMKAGRLRYITPDGKAFYGNISLQELKKAALTASLKPVTVMHPPGLLKPSDVTAYQEGVSADGYDVEKIDGEDWLVGNLVLQSEKAINTAEEGETGVSAGYKRSAIPTDVEGEFDFKDIDINHIAIGCKNPRAAGAGLSLDEAEDDSARIYSFATQQKTKKEVKMKYKLNAVKVGAFSLDEAPIEYNDDDSSTAIDVMVGREGKMVENMQKIQTSMDDAETVHVAAVGELSGENKGLKVKIEELEKKQEGMVSLDDIDARVEEMSGIRAVADKYDIKVEFKTPAEGQRAIVEGVYPDQSFDDAEIPGAYKTITVDEKDVKEVLKSKKALKKGQSLDSGERVSLSQIDADELIKRKKNKR